MSIQHKFLANNWGNGFQTHNAILDVTPYEPEVLILGTFNPNTPNANFADFFYGRNYFWPAIKNLFYFNHVQITRTRMPRRSKALIQNLDPTLLEIFSLCQMAKFTFADMVREVLHNDNSIYNVLANDNVVLNTEEYNLIQDGRSGVVGGLAELNAIGQVDWNTDKIISYLCANPQIKHVYFTRQATGIWGVHWNRIISDPCMKNRICTNIFSPSGQGLLGKPRMNTLLRHWVHNTAPGFGRLDNHWLQSLGVTLSNF